jgi:predicted GIY-YIG superfamily endonuclease
MRGRTVRIFLVDGIPTGVLTAEIMNWIGRVTVAPRIQLTDLANRLEVKRTGLYILSGDDPDNPNQEVIYIGESDNVWSRLIQHNRDVDKDFWRRTVVITSKDDNLTKAHVRYLESRLIQLANQAQRARLLNGTNPEPTSLPEPDVADMEYFLEQIEMLLPVLGLSFAVPLPTINIGQDTSDIQVESPMLYMNYAGVNAYAQEINGEFIVLRSSTVRKTDTPSLAPSHA